MTPRKTPPTERTLPLDLHGVADLLGLKHSTVKSKRHDGELPLPDARLGNADLWWPETITGEKKPRKARDLPVDLRGFAQHLGLQYTTVKRYRHDDRLPEPDARLGNADLWFTDTIDQWNANRPGRGWHGPHD